LEILSISGNQLTGSIGQQIDVWKEVIFFFALRTMS
jgi:hypothetical protein